MFTLNNVKQTIHIFEMSKDVDICLLVHNSKAFDIYGESNENVVANHKFSLLLCFQRETHVF